MIRTSLMVALVIVLAGCTRWVPARIGTVPVGTDVRLRLSDEGAERVEESTGTRLEEVSGELLRWADDVMVSAPILTSRGTAGGDLGQRVILDIDEILGIDVRERDRTRTMLLIGGAGLGVGGVIALTVMKLISGSSPPATPQVPDVPTFPSVLTLFRIFP